MLHTDSATLYIYNQSVLDKTARSPRYNAPVNVSFDTAQDIPNNR
jgi:hypothetical protein